MIEKGGGMKCFLWIFVLLVLFACSTVEKEQPEQAIIQICNKLGLKTIPLAGYKDGSPKLYMCTDMEIVEPSITIVEER